MKNQEKKNPSNKIVCFYLLFLYILSIKDLLYFSQIDNILALLVYSFQFRRYSYRLKIVVFNREYYSSNAGTEVKKDEVNCWGFHS